MPLVVRLEGTNVELGKKILQQSGLPILAAENLADAAQKVVAAVKEAALMAILVDASTKVILPGLHRRAGHLPLRAGDRLRHQDGRRRDAGQRRDPSSRPAGVQYGARGARRDRLRRDA